MSTRSLEITRRDNVLSSVFVCVCVLVVGVVDSHKRKEISFLPFFFSFSLVFFRKTRNKKTAREEYQLRVKTDSKWEMNRVKTAEGIRRVGTNTMPRFLKVILFSLLRLSTRLRWSMRARRTA